MGALASRSKDLSVVKGRATAAVAREVGRVRGREEVGGTEKAEEEVEVEGAGRCRSPPGGQLTHNLAKLSFLHNLEP